MDFFAPLWLATPSRAKRGLERFLERPEVDVDVFTATKAIAPAAMKSVPARAMHALRIELVLDFILPPMREGWERRSIEQEWVG